MNNNTRKECSFCENHYLVLCFYLFWVHYSFCKEIGLIYLVTFNFMFYIHFPYQGPRSLDGNYKRTTEMEDNGSNFMKVIGPLDEFVVDVLGQARRYLLSCLHYNLHLFLESLYLVIYLECRVALPLVVLCNYNFQVLLMLLLSSFHIS